MKTIKIAVCAFAVAGAFVAGKTMADDGSNGLLLNISGTVKYQGLENGIKGTAPTRSLNEIG